MPIASSKGFDPSSYAFHAMAYGFGYDSLHDDYKLMTVDRSSNTRVYNMKSNLWKRTLGFPLPFCPDQSVGVFASGALHCMISPMSCVEESNRLIIAIDLASGHYFPKLLTPPENGDREQLAFSLRVLNGLLTMSCHYLEEGRVDVWVMKEYGVTESWTKLLFTHVLCLIRPLAYSNSGNEVEMESYYNKLLSYDLEKKIMESLQGLSLEWPTTFEIQVFGEGTFEAQVFVGRFVNPVTMAGGDSGTIWKPGKPSEGEEGISCFS